VNVVAADFVLQRQTILGIETDEFSLVRLSDFSWYPCQPSRHDTGLCPQNVEQGRQDLCPTVGPPRIFPPVKECGGWEPNFKLESHT